MMAVGKEGGLKENRMGREGKGIMVKGGKLYAAIRLVREGSE